MLDTLRAPGILFSAVFKLSANTDEVLLCARHWGSSSEQTKSLLSEG